MSDILLYKTESFEGPMDLLLTLISKNQLDIYDIQISVLLEQYLIQIEKMQNLDMEISSEFLQMATRLVQIKSAALLPKHEDEPDLKKELEGQLIEYQQCKLVAAKLALMVNLNSLVKPSENISVDRKYKRLHNKSELIPAYFSAVGRGKRMLPVSEEKFSGIVATKIVSVATGVVYVLRKLWKKGESSYKDLFKDNKEKSEKVATFLALLSLVKSKRVKITDDDKLILVKGGRKNANK
ncbi:MAG: segregation/condensation protein A [Clostridia bacterium]